MKMVHQLTLLVAALTLLAVSNAEDDWKDVDFGTEIPIDFEISKLELRTFGFRSAFFKSITVQFSAGSDKETTGLSIKKITKAIWRIEGCGFAGTREGAEGNLPDEAMSEGEDIITLWREDITKVNLMMNDIAVLDNYAVLDEIKEGSCVRDPNNMWPYPERLDFAEDFTKKVTSIYINGDLGTVASLNTFITGYRIVSKKDEEGNEEGNKEGNEEGNEEGNGENTSYVNGDNRTGKIFNTLSTILFIARVFF